MHGGLTFADRCMEGLPEDQGVCHIPAPGRPADVWWLGFDCGHAFDLSPGLEARMRQLRAEHPDLQASHDQLQAMASRFDNTPIWHDVYRDLAYVRDETARLARQVAEQTEGPDAA